MKDFSRNIEKPVTETADTVRRIYVRLEGFVQGLGFRPFVYRLASKYSLSGSVANSVAGVEIEVEGRQEILQKFLEELDLKKPPLSRISNRTIENLQPLYQPGFVVKESTQKGEKSALILPDLAICSDCLKEIRDPSNRRYRYPFTNCTYCGPRYSIIEAIPYDRTNTTMRRFRMCPECWKEYNDPENRRFHAQPNACPACGPRLALLDQNGKSLCTEGEAIIRAADAIKQGKIVALKGLGGFQLIVDARNGLNA